jgi:carbonic anhydrase
MSRFVDQTIVWILALVLAGGFFSGVYGIFRYVAERRLKAETELVEQVAPESAKNKSTPVAAEGDSVQDDPKSTTAARENLQTPWGYSGSIAPEHWESLDSAWRICGNGKRQSPIDLTNARIDPKLKPIVFNYRRSGAEFLQRGSRFEVEIEHGNWVEIEGDRFGLTTISFHTPSEHYINGLPWEMEIQLHHRSTTGDEATISLLVAPGRSPEAIDQLWAHLPKESGEVNDVPGLKVVTLLPKRKNYFHYVGSMTSPPCKEGVRWYVMTETIGMSKAAIDRFVKVARHNARPLQPLNGRRLSRSSR